MLKPEELIRWLSPELASGQTGLANQTLLINLAGPFDAGEVLNMIESEVLLSCQHQLIADFDMDEIYDYSGRRPKITLDREVFRDFKAPKMNLYQAWAQDATPFLFLTGQEPCYRWEAVAKAVIHLVRTLQVAEVLFVHSRPAAIPHTKEPLVIYFATDPALIGVFDGLQEYVEMQSFFTALCCLRLGEVGIKARGMIAQVPHYLADGEYPKSTLVMLEKFKDFGLPLTPSSELLELAENTEHVLANEVAEHVELQELLTQLEDEYDAYTKDLAARKDNLPQTISDDFVAEIEAFLNSDDAGLGKLPDKDNEGDH